MSEHYVPGDAQRFIKLARKATPNNWQQSHFVEDMRTMHWSVEKKKKAHDHECRTVRGPGKIGDGACNPLFTLEGPEATPENVEFLVWCANHRSLITELLLKEEENGREKP